jgi:hypothetical protein
MTRECVLTIDGDLLYAAERALGRLPFEMAIAFVQSWNKGGEKCLLS